MTMPDRPRHPLRIYCDTSVFGGCFDEEFESASRAFFDHVREGSLRLVISSLVEEEIETSPEQVRDFFLEFEDLAEYREVTEAAVILQQAYLEHEVVGSASMADALHVAMATVFECHAIVSWNFKHIVNFRRIPLYTAVNRIEGYHEIAIHTPLEVSSLED